MRVALAALVLAGPAIVALRGRWRLLRRNLALVTGYGLAAVAGCQLAYFYAVEHMQVGVALLIEYTAPVAVLAWMWLRHGHRPGRLTLAGARAGRWSGWCSSSTCSRAPTSAWWAWAGRCWRCWAPRSTSSCRPSEDNGLPPIVLAAGGLPWARSRCRSPGSSAWCRWRPPTAAVSYAGARVPFWLPAARRSAW